MARSEYLVLSCCSLQFPGDGSERNIWRRIEVVVTRRARNALTDSVRGFESLRLRHTWPNDMCCLAFFFARIERQALVKPKP